VLKASMRANQLRFCPISAGHEVDVLVAAQAVLAVLVSSERSEPPGPGEAGVLVVTADTIVPIHRMDHAVRDAAAPLNCR
jgi:hypothetical protein